MLTAELGELADSVGIGAQSLAAAPLAPEALLGFFGATEQLENGGYLDRLENGSLGLQAIDVSAAVLQPGEARKGRESAAVRGRG